jgi:hypothetical protein
VFALFFLVWFGVASTFFFTRATWFHAEAAAVWLWMHATFVFFFTRINESNENVEQHHANELGLQESPTLSREPPEPKNHKPNHK